MYQQKRLIKLLHEELDRCNRKIKWMKSVLPGLPEGYLGFTNNNYYHIIKKNGIRVQTMLPQGSKTDMDTVYSLQLKRHIVKALPILENNVKFYGQLLKHIRKYDIKAIHSLLPQHYQKFCTSPLMLDGDIDPEEWCNQNYHQNQGFPADLIHKSVGGLFTRSKAEAMIATMLEQAGLFFRYEPELNLGRHRYFPDFVILHPKHRRLVYWEHFGKMGDTEYANDAMEKLRVYSQNHIWLGDNFIMTWESLEHPLTFQHIEDRIAIYLG